MTLIKKSDFINSIADALQYISYYHPMDFIHSLYEAYQKEINPSAKDAIGQILINSKMCAQGKRPICQDTGIVTCFVKIGMQIQWDTDDSIQSMVDEGVRTAYQNPDNPLRASIVKDPAGKRINTKDNTPAVVHIDLVSGNKVEVMIAAKGGGSENKSKMVILNPSDSITDWVIKTLPTMGAGWCPPGMLGIGIGGTAEKAAVMAKESLMESIDIQNLYKKDKNTLSTEDKLRLEIYEKANALGIGAQGLGGLTTVLDVKIKSAPTHAASKPVVMIPNCAATRHIHFTLDGSGEAQLPTPNINDWPQIDQTMDENVKQVNVDDLTKASLQQYQAGDVLLLSGHILTGRDAAHKRLTELLNNNQPFPEGVDLKNRFIYYVGPVDPIKNEVVGPAGPTTATRMDKFTEQLLSETGLIGMIGKAERGPNTVESIKKHRCIYLMAVGGAAYLVSKAIKSSKLVAFEDLGMEAIYEFKIQDMPVMVAVDSQGNNIHETGPVYWQGKINDNK